VKKLTDWIAGYTSNTYLTRNLSGLQPLPIRFADLKTTFQVIIRQSSNESHLKAFRGLDWQFGSFYRCLTNDQTFHQPSISAFLTPNTRNFRLRSSLPRFLSRCLMMNPSQTIAASPMWKHLSHSISWISDFPLHSHMCIVSRVASCWTGNSATLRLPYRYAWAPTTPKQSREPSNLGIVARAPRLSHCV
jgi:hypothetical protein